MFFLCFNFSSADIQLKYSEHTSSPLVFSSHICCRNGLSRTISSKQSTDKYSIFELHLNYSTKNNFCQQANSRSVIQLILRLL
jgi:hypothetical protein